MLLVRGKAAVLLASLPSLSSETRGMIGMEGQCRKLSKQIRTLQC